MYGKSNVLILHQIALPSWMGILILPEPERPMCTIFEEGGGNWMAQLADEAAAGANAGWMPVMELPAPCTRTGR